MPDEQPGRVFVGEGGASAPPPRPGSINLERHISSVITDVTGGRNEAPVEVVKQANLLRKVCLHCIHQVSSFIGVIWSFMLNGVPAPQTNQQPRKQDSASGAYAFCMSMLFWVLHYLLHILL